MINIINEMDNKFGLMNLFRAGIIPWTVLRDRDIFLQYDIYIRTGTASMQAKQNTADSFKVDIRTVERAIKKMNEENSNTPAEPKGEI